jgi:hypothetical protein
VCDLELLRGYERVVRFSLGVDRSERNSRDSA